MINMRKNIIAYIDIADGCALKISNRRKLSQVFILSLNTSRV